MNFQNGSPRATLGSLVPLAMFYTNSMRTTEDSSILKLRFCLWHIIFAILSWMRWKASKLMLFTFHFQNPIATVAKGRQRPARFSFLENSRDFFSSFSLLVLDLEPFQFHFHFSKKSEGILFFTFHFSKKVKAIHISLFFLEKKEWNQVRAITSPLSLFPIVFPKIVKSQVSTSLKILAKFQFQNLDQTLCSKSEPNISLKKVTKTRLKFNCAHLRSTKESLTFKYFDTGRYWLVLGQYRTVRVDIW